MTSESPGGSLTLATQRSHLTFTIAMGRLLCIARTLATLLRGDREAFNDLDAARKFLQQQPEVDPARIGV